MDVDVEDHEEADMNVNTNNDVSNNSKVLAGDQDRVIALPIGEVVGDSVSSTDTKAILLPGPTTSTSGGIGSTTPARREREAGNKGLSPVSPVTGTGAAATAWCSAWVLGWYGRASGRTTRGTISA